MSPFCLSVLLDQALEAFFFSGFFGLVPSGFILLRNAVSRN